MSSRPLFDSQRHGEHEGLPHQEDCEAQHSTWRKLRLVVHVCNRFRYFSMNGIEAKKNVNSSAADAHGEFSDNSLLLRGKHKSEITGDVSNIHDVLASKFRVVAHALRAVQRFKLGLQYSNEVVPLPGYAAGYQNFDEGAPGEPNVNDFIAFGIGPDELRQLMGDAQVEALEKLGGVTGVSKLVKTDVANGFEDEDAGIEARRAAFGSNKVPSKPGKGFWSFVWDASKDTTLIILMVCAVVSLAAEMWSDGPKEGWYDGASIAAAVAIVIAVTATSDYRQSLQFQSLSEEKRNIQVEAVRGGRRCKMSVFDIVVGDIVPLGVGDQVPADGILVAGQSLSVDESSMTGESHPVAKSAKQPFLMAGCKIVDGYGTMLVIAVGTNTEWGQVMSTLSEDNGEETPLQARLGGAAKFIGEVGLSVAVVVFIILFIRFFAVDFKKNKSASNAINKIVNAFAIAVTIVVVAVPEGLPLAVTLTLAYSMRKMMNDKSMVRNLAACETMGSATTICSDKTGTLTLNQMTVVRSWVAGELLESEAIRSRISNHVYETLLRGICQNSSGSVFVPKDGGIPEVSGSPTESAALSWGLQIGMDYNEIKKITSVVHVETFNSAKKRAGVVIRRVDGEVEAHWKGAAEIILGYSDKWVDESGAIQPMTPEKAIELNNCIGGMAAKSLRCVAFAYRSVKGVPNTEEELREWEIPSECLTFLCIIGIKDPCRPGVREAVARCQAARVKVRMVTGDSLLTAKAIAEECGILTNGGEVVEGRVFREFSKEEMERVLPRLDVVARSSPSDKLLLVKELKRLGEVVGVTGDGTNDAPALHEADVGLSMGLCGTEVAKESSDIVILDDNFASIVKVVRWGRSVYSNIQKFIQFQLTVNATALVINFVAAVSSGKVPLTAVQLLWVNLIMDTLGALALATEPPTDDLMDRTPVGRKEPLITNVMWRNIISQSLYQIVVLMIIDYSGRRIFNLQRDPDGEVKKNTIVFNAFVMCQVFNEVNARRPVKLNIFEGLFKNRLFVGIIAIEVVFQFIIVQFLRKFATTKALTWQQWLICVAIGSVAWPIGLLVKFIPVREKPFVNTHGMKFKWLRRKTSTTSSTEVCNANAPDYVL